jgi:chromosome partitioning protein
MIYGLTNSKGGVGKTTIAVHLAAWLAREKRRVVFIDADPQQSASTWIKELGLPIELHQLATPEEIFQRVAKLKTVANDIVIDGPAGLSTTTRAIMLKADRVFLPCGPSILDLRALTKAVALLKDAQKARKGKLTGALIPNRLQKRGRLSSEVLRAAEKIGIPILPTLTLRQPFADAAGQASVVWKMGILSRAAACEMEDLLEEMTRD